MMPLRLGRKNYPRRSLLVLRFPLLRRHNHPPPVSNPDNPIPLLHLFIHFCFHGPYNPHPIHLCFFLSHPPALPSSLSQLPDVDVFVDDVPITSSPHFPASLRHQTPSVTHQVDTPDYPTPMVTQGRDSITSSRCFKSPHKSLMHSLRASAVTTLELTNAIAQLLPRLCKPRSGDSVSQTGHPINCRLVSICRSTSSLNLLCPTLNPEAQLCYSTMPPRYDCACDCYQTRPRQYTRPLSALGACLLF